MKSIPTKLFILFAAIFISSILLKPYPLSWLVKLLPMAVLIFVTRQQVKTKAERLFLFGLAFSALGDFFLDYDRVNWFIFGLGSFLVAHLFYMLSLKPVKFIRKPVIALYILYGVAMFSLITPGLGELFLPVLVYMLVLLLMGITTLISDKSNKWLIAGGCCFVFSDSLIGIDKFYQSIPYAHIWIMISYYAAQYSLVRGIFIRRS